MLISYSHDSPEHKARVLELAQRLRAEGVDCWIDQYVSAPPEGWPNWMRSQIRNANHVLVVCTQTYQRRVDLEEDPGRGLGATWEGGLITLAAYATQGKNDRFIPVVFSVEDAAYIPDFLQGASFYNVATEEGYTALYARLTGQQLVSIPPLGPRRTVGAQPEVGARVPNAGTTAVQSASSPPTSPPVLALLVAPHGQAYLEVERIEESGGRIELTLIPHDGEDAAFLSELTKGWGQQRIWVAYSDTAREATVEAADRSHSKAGERWRVVLIPGDGNSRDLSEMGTTGKSIDDIAELRARRILLDERPPAELARWGRIDNTVEMLVQGLDSRLAVKASPLPALYQELGSDRLYFLAAARLAAIFALRRTGTVEHVLQLDIGFAEGGLRVQFRGRRQKYYTNQPAHEITVEGVCPLPT
ncbi:MAG TPA: toll/interleukin-1 receptor domain-containing protein [Longimicrobium sp.]|nr:toll/interleukin-1 receptor domain-containing protein [Longimicrobium sp.]